MKTVLEITEYLGKHITSFPTCVETGSMYTCPPGNEVHNTTNNIYFNIVIPNEGWLLSLDIDEEHIKFADSYLSSRNSGVKRYDFFLGDSVETLKYLVFEPRYIDSGIDLVCLDSKDFDEMHMVKEYMALYPTLNKQHYILVDDIHNPNSVKYKKTMPLLKELGYDWREVPTPTGMFVASMGYPLWEKE